MTREGVDNCRRARGLKEIWFGNMGWEENIGLIVILRHTCPQFGVYLDKRSPKKLCTAKSIMIADSCHTSASTREEID